MDQTAYTYTHLKTRKPLKPVLIALLLVFLVAAVAGTVYLSQFSQDLRSRASSTNSPWMTVANTSRPDTWDVTFDGGTTPASRSFYSMNLTLGIPKLNPTPIPARVQGDYDSVEADPYYYNEGQVLAYESSIDPTDPSGGPASTCCGSDGRVCRTSSEWAAGYDACRRGECSACKVGRVTPVPTTTGGGSVLCGGYAKPGETHCNVDDCFQYYCNPDGSWTKTTQGGVCMGQAVCKGSESQYCYNLVTWSNGRYVWPGCKTMPPGGCQLAAQIPLTEEEIVSYKQWVSAGKVISPSCKGSVTPTPPPTGGMELVHSGNGFEVWAYTSSLWTFGPVSMQPSDPTKIVLTANISNPKDAKVQSALHSQHKLFQVKIKTSPQTINDRPTIIKQSIMGTWPGLQGRLVELYKTPSPTPKPSGPTPTQVTVSPTPTLTTIFCDYKTPCPEGYSCLEPHCPPGVPCAYRPYCVPRTTSTPTPSIRCEMGNPASCPSGYTCMQPPQPKCIKAPCPSLSPAIPTCVYTGTTPTPTTSCKTGVNSTSFLTPCKIGTLPGYLSMKFSCYDGFSSSISSETCTTQSSLITQAQKVCSTHSTCPTPTRTPTPTPTTACKTGVNTMYYDSPCRTSTGTSGNLAIRYQCYDGYTSSYSSRTCMTQTSLAQIAQNGCQGRSSCSTKQTPTPISERDRFPQPTFDPQPTNSLF